MQAEVERLADTRQRRALAVFDVLDEWFHSCDFDCRSAIGTFMEGTDSARSDRDVPPGRLGLSRATLEAYAEQAGSPNPCEAGHQLQLLMVGAILSAGHGDDRAATHARSLAELLLDGFGSP
jgi:hypothetical protein